MTKTYNVADDMNEADGKPSKITGEPGEKLEIFILPEKPPTGEYIVNATAPVHVHANEISEIVHTQGSSATTITTTGINDDFGYVTARGTILTNGQVTFTVGGEDNSEGQERTTDNDNPNHGHDHVFVGQSPVNITETISGPYVDPTTGQKNDVNYPKIVTGGATNDKFDYTITDDAEGYIKVNGNGGFDVLTLHAKDGTLKHLDNGDYKFIQELRGGKKLVMDFKDIERTDWVVDAPPSQTPVLAKTAAREL